MSAVTLKFPWWRTKLMTYLDEIGSRDMLLRWPNDPASAKARANLRYAIKLIFDTLGSDDDLENLIGAVFYDTDEANAMRPFVRHFDHVFETAADDSDLALITHPDWTCVMQAARDAFEVLASRQRH